MNYTMDVTILTKLCPLQYSLSTASRVCVKISAPHTRHSSSSEGVSRYPVPNKKNLPFDIVELMEEVEQKVWLHIHVKVIVHPKMKSLSFTHSNVISNQYGIT